MTDFVRILQFLVAEGLETSVRLMARHAGVSEQGDIRGVIHAIAALSSDLTDLVRRCASREDWNDLLDQLGGSRQAEFADIARALVSRVNDRLDDEDGADGADAGEDGADEDEDDEADPLPDDVFDFDPKAAEIEAWPYQRELTEAIERALSGAEAGSRHRITVATGGGKTRIANDWIAAHALFADERVLWVTKDWPLLRQAASDLCRRHGVSTELGYVGARGRMFLAALEQDVTRNVVYTTIHTWKSRRTQDFADIQFDVVIIDESHWGEGKTAYRALRKRYRRTAKFLGLTATPRDGTDYRLIGREYNYARLVHMGYLAQHIIEPPVATGVTWLPSLLRGRGDFDRTSLGELARSDARNRCIVETYRRNHQTFGKSLVFACDVAHAKALTRALVDAGFAAEAVHSGMEPRQQTLVVKRFREGHTRVLVNVAMMTHGVDIPDIETVFLARPTTSRILFAQMIGRAARRTETKTHFRIVDFVDTLQAYGHLLVSPTGFFDAVETPVAREHPRREDRTRHPYAPAGFEYVPLRPWFGEIAGFDVQPSQAFWIELELTRRDFCGPMPADWASVAEALRRAIPNGVKKHFEALRDSDSEQRSHEEWNVEWDPLCGWKVTSRSLSGADGFYEVVHVCRALDAAAARLGLCMDKRTGAYVHLAWKPDLQTLRRLVQLVAHHESALYTLVAPSRAGNRHCIAIRSRMKPLLALDSLDAWASYFLQPENRCLSVNPGDLFGGDGTVEVRLHGGTLKGAEILGWVSLWMRILQAVEQPIELPDEEVRLGDLPLEDEPRGDVRQLVHRVSVGHELASYLLRRRAAVMERWRETGSYGGHAAELMKRWSIDAVKS